MSSIYQNDDYGKDYLAGLKRALGTDSLVKIIAEASYELSDPTVDSEGIRLKASGAGTLIYFTTPNFAAQAIKKANELNWKPAQFLANPVNSVSVLSAAGLENVQGAFTTQFTKQAGDPAWAAGVGDGLPRPPRAIVAGYWALYAAQVYQPCRRHSNRGLSVIYAIVPRDVENHCDRQRECC
jgi:hypothetical protein